MPTNPIACRTASYHEYETGAFAHLAGIGIRCVEIPVPTDQHALQQTQQRLAEHGLRATTLHGEADVTRADIADRVAAQMPAFKALGCNLMFVSCKHDDTPLDTVYNRLRAAGDVAQAHDVTIVIETHPQLFTNGTTARKTIQAVGHPHVRINFDTANMYFYEHEIDAVVELRKIIEFVAAVHLKDHNGAHRTWHFPALGRGIIDFPAIFAELDAANFNGPYTLEIEGIEGEQRSETLVHERIAESVAYLRTYGRL